MKIVQGIVALLSVACLTVCGLVLVVVAHDATGFLLMLVAVGICAAVAVIASVTADEPGEDDELCAPHYPLPAPSRPRVAGRHHQRRKP